MSLPPLELRGLQFYPGAGRSLWCPPPGPWPRSPAAGVEIRATETTTRPAYRPGEAPTFSVALDGLDVDIQQHMPVTVPPRPSATRVVIHLVGTCKADSDGMYWPTAPAWARDPVVRLWVWLHEQHQTRLPGSWLAALHKPIIREEQYRTAVLSGHGVGPA